MPGLGPYPYRAGKAPDLGSAPTLDDKISAIRQRFPLAKLPDDFGAHPNDMAAIERLSSSMPQWAQSARSAISNFFAPDAPKTNEIMSRVGSMKRAGGGRSTSDVEYQGLLRAGRLLVDHAFPSGQARNIAGRALSKSNEYYTKQIPYLTMSVKDTMSAKSALGDAMEMSGYVPNPEGGYFQTRDINSDVISSIYSEAAARGLEPNIVAMEKMSTAIALENPEVQKRVIQDRPTPLWQNEDGSIVRDVDLEEGPNKATKMMRYVPKFMERNDQA